MKQIWKYSLEMTDIAEVVMPFGAEVLSAVNQHGILCIWAMVDPNEQNRITRRFRIIGTGHPIEDKEQLGKFLGTVQFEKGQLILHVFDMDAL